VTKPVNYVSLSSIIVLELYSRMGKGKKGRTARNNIQANAEEEPEELKRAPHSLSTAVVLLVMLLSLEEILEK
jgi:hypothetical protein